MVSGQNENDEDTSFFEFYYENEKKITSLEVYIF